MSLKAGEKQMVIYRDKHFIPCDRDHPDYIPVRVSDLTVSVERPAHREKGPSLRTGDVS